MSSIPSRLSTKLWWSSAVAGGPGRDHSAYCALGRFPGLDGLRGIAALMVVVYHCPKILIPGLSALQRGGDLGVDIFFVLSGFLITALLLREPEGTPHRRLGCFMAKRVLRIFPLYFAAIGLYWLKSGYLGNESVSHAYHSFLPWLSGFCGDIYLGRGVEIFPNFGIAWSLGVEEKFYLLWPLFVVFCSRRVLGWTAMIGIVSCGLWRWHLAGSYDGDLTARLYYAFDTRMDGILWGCILACVLHGRLGYGKARRVLGLPGLALASLMMFGLLSGVALNVDLWRYLVMPVLAVLLIGGMMVRSGDRLAKWLDGRVLRHVGRVSYGVYVLHPIVVSVVVRLVGSETVIESIVCVVVSCVTTVLVATVSFLLYESPFLRLKKGLRPRRGPVEVKSISISRG